MARGSSVAALRERKGREANEAHFVVHLRQFNMGFTLYHCASKWMFLQCAGEKRGGGLGCQRRYGLLFFFLFGPSTDVTLFDLTTATQQS